VKVEGLDPLGYDHCIIDSLGIVKIINEQITPDAQEQVLTGEAVKAMVLNGMGFASHLLMFTPQFFDNLPMVLLFGEGVEPDHFNRHKFWRAPNAVFSSGCDNEKTETIRRSRMSEISNFASYRLINVGFYTVVSWLGEFLKFRRKEKNDTLEKVFS
jgi:Domain of unknown function (DUF4277)